MFRKIMVPNFVLFGYQIGASEILLIILAVFVIFLVVRNLLIKTDKAG
ncbi:hypothetical protein [Pedobacter sp. GR22-6]